MKCKLNALLSSNCNPVNKVKICREGLAEDEGLIWEGNTADLDVKHKQLRVNTWYIDFLEYASHTDVQLVAFIK